MEKKKYYRYVYVLMNGCVGDYGINSIYSSKKKAEDAKKKLLCDKNYHSDIWIEKFEVE